MYLFTSEAVSPGHPDKCADIVADSYVRVVNEMPSRKILVTGKCRWTSLQNRTTKIEEKQMLLDVIEVEPKDDFLLLLKFENGEQKEFDCKPLFDKKPFQKLQDKSFFNRAKVMFGTVGWPDEIDIAPETLYIDSK